MQYFTNLFTDLAPHSSSDFSLVDSLIPQLVIHNQNMELTRTPDMEEIKHTVFAMDLDSAAGPDGFNGKFYQVAWDVVYEDVTAAIRSFFSSGKIAKGLNSNFLILIPKSPNASMVNQYRPIVLGNFLFKNISKILANRLGIIVQQIISINQFGCISGRRIHDCIALASDATIKLLEPQILWRQ